ncbi:hypothetical protein EVAR_57996_1 [Eumeta japonica]|uniref:Uncharacterized protein n=1 Tax=Eumeta variegata TaxID=151549 RepID=A0A4C1YB18_EUMVA|nr:hypothetical protein EVAR_57996_1 [Eumeta japonica]
MTHAHRLAHLRVKATRETGLPEARAQQQKYLPMKTGSTNFVTNKDRRHWRRKAFNVEHERIDQCVFVANKIILLVLCLREHVKPSAPVVAIVLMAMAVSSHRPALRQRVYQRCRNTWKLSLDCRKEEYARFIIRVRVFPGEVSLEFAGTSILPVALRSNSIYKNITYVLKNLQSYSSIDYSACGYRRDIHVADASNSMYYCSSIIICPVTPTRWICLYWNQKVPGPVAAVTAAVGSSEPGAIRRGAPRPDLK